MKWLLILATASALHAHDVITTAVTFNREISRIVLDKCASCHRPNGSAFSLVTYGDARPWAVAIKEEILRRRMPPWGAVKGFGDFRNDQALNSEELERLISWIDGGTPEGEPKDLPEIPKSFPPLPKSPGKGSLDITADYKLPRPFRLGGLQPKSATSAKLTAELPDGTILPLLWLDTYDPKFSHPFLLRAPVDLPAGTQLRSTPPGAAFTLLPPAPEPTSASR